MMQGESPFPLSSPVHVANHDAITPSPLHPDTSPPPLRTRRVSVTPPGQSADRRPLRRRPSGLPPPLRRPAPINPPNRRSSPSPSSAFSLPSTAASPTSVRKITKGPNVDIQKVQAEQKRRYLEMLEDVEDDLLQRKKEKDEQTVGRGGVVKKAPQTVGKLIQRHQGRERSVAEKIRKLSLDPTHQIKASPFASSCFRYHPTISSDPLRFRPIPDLQDDFYLNVLDWGASNAIAYAEPNSVHLWNPWSDSEVKFYPDGILPKMPDPVNPLVSVGVRPLNIQTEPRRESPVPPLAGGRRWRLAEIHNRQVTMDRRAGEARRLVSGRQADHVVAGLPHRTPICPRRGVATDVRRLSKVCSVKFHREGRQIGVGLYNGEVELWDVGESPKLLARYPGHGDRVSALAWNGHCLTSGGRDHKIIYRDIREGAGHRRIWVGHEQEVCGLTWSGNEQWLASGGNDNLVNVWDARRVGTDRSTLFSFGAHTAAVKALSWNPMDTRMLLTGAGTGDQNLRFVDAGLGEVLERVFTGAQVCNVLWSRDGEEIISTHGYALNQVNLWNYPEMEKVSTVSSHMYRVLYLSASPDGEHIVTGAGREGLKLWRIFGRGKRRRLQEEEPPSASLSVVMC
eukprot:GHVS01069376.1.p1 GENE.GHVS01069376.1~~GHVS01069376.1.p1  ORF type:complete len:624 (+),score=91.41 GHVS01069376.1:123-1994(+)